MKQKVFLLLLLNLSFAFSQSLSLTVADSLYTIGNYSKAINEYAKVGDEKASLQISRAYTTIGNYEKAIIQYESLLSSNPDLQIARFELGKLYVRSNKYNKALKVFSQLVSKVPSNPEFHYFLGEANRELEQSASSLVSYKNAVQQDSTHLRSLFQLAKYFTIKQERNQAMEYINRGLHFYKNDVALINLKALVFYNDYQYENAIPWFERVLELGETKDYIYEKLADSYHHNWEFEKAKGAYQVLLDRDDANSQTYFNLAKVYEKQKELDSAKIYINKAMEVQKPIFAQGFATLASIARQQNDLPLALKLYKQAHVEDKSNVRIYYNICTIFDQLGNDLEKKLDYYQDFLKLYPNEHPYFYKLVEKRIRELKEQIHFSKD